MINEALTAVEGDTSLDAALPLLRAAAGVFAATRDGADRVFPAHSAEELFARFDEAMPRDGQPLEAIVERIERDFLPDCNQLTHPMSMGHQVASPLPAAVWTEPVISALNQSMAVWEMSPVGTVLERRVIEWMTELVGWDATSGGTLTSGGTEATFTALLAARNAAVPDAWQNGVGADPPVLVCGEHAHYAVARAAGELGIGYRNVVTIGSRDFRMDVEALAHRLRALHEEGKRVMAVVATSGSTATGSFDDLERIGALCDEHGIWMHVDGAHGASALLSEERRGMLRGIERARSVAWDPHKGMFLPLAAGMLLVRDARDLGSAFAQRAPYLFVEREGARNWDAGMGSFQCSRRADVLKLWVALQRYGSRGIAAVYDHLCDLTRSLYDTLQARSDFETLHVPESNILCFRYVDDRRSAAEVDDLNARMRTAFNDSGAGWITRTILGGRPVLRVTLMNHRTREAHVAALVDRLAAVGRTLS